MTKQKPVTSYLTATKKYNGVTYKLFDNNYCFIHDTEVEEKLNFDIGSTMGIVFEGGEGEAIEFINAHTD
jgi:urease beta subunit